MTENRLTTSDSASDRTARVPSYLLQLFKFEHLPPHLQETSKKFAEVAAYIDTLPSNPETTTALRKLLEAKDCAVRSLLFK